MNTKIKEDQFAEFEKYDVLSDKDVFSKIWLQPRRVFKFINDTKYEKYFYVLMFLAGVLRALDRTSSKENTSLFFVILTSLFIGGLLGWISYYIYAALLSWTGKWLDGKGDTSSIFRMMAYAMFPSILSIVFLILQIDLDGNNIFNNYDYTAENNLINIIVYTSVFIKIGLSVVSLIFMVIGLSVVQNFSIGKTILNLILPILFIVVPIVLIASLAMVF